MFKSQFLGIKQIYTKMWEAIFKKYFLILETERLFHDLSINSVQETANRQ
ncbi:hypothetical protein HMPREF1365_00710, partial [Enterococcus faecium ERV168]